MNRLAEIRDKVSSYPTPKPIFKVEVDYSGDLCFRRPNADVKSPFENPNAIEQVIQECVSPNLVKKDHHTYMYEHDVYTTESRIMEHVMSFLKQRLAKALESKEYKRTNIYKFFRSYAPRNDKDKEFILAMYDFAKTNMVEIDSKGSKKAQAFVGLVAHLQGSKNGRN